MLLGPGLLCVYLVYQILIPHRKLAACLPPVCQGSGNPGVCAG